MRRSVATPVLVLLLLSLVGPGCAVTEPEPEQLVTLEVAPHLAPCTALIPRQCLLIREPGSQEWGRFYDEIVGFAWEEGYLHTIVVAITPIADPPQDSGSALYTLLRVISRVPAEP